MESYTKAHVSAPPQQNGIAKRKNRLLEVAQSLIFTTHMQKLLLGRSYLNCSLPNQPNAL